ncbi:hypothetical protein VOLCADRAFT_86071 [Volvox carteri f. nagariensis]|uniref:Fucolectin tachylectin-4 pentraxin-1 domain-containing protein n=1 Tax=Volvox carteri f. nagariensis TaxID=3068 RepID=D8THS5_VOLCA|nr:uncharacterized protein VOLCADRAFT_86071 [Volvox carteri f. nagariensis]EFJ53118.1 hypothetical protein VOLCADRAFT_86071 [Volvox carteri f. nagariensis]|eukprot:XP_002946123.1 hypothetical protein VOLCADRAFT_86071 [Volvox carteri f. nagariensis]
MEASASPQKRRPPSPLLRLVYANPPPPTVSSAYPAFLAFPGPTWGAPPRLVNYLTSVRSCPSGAQPLRPFRGPDARSGLISRPRPLRCCPPGAAVGKMDGTSSNASRYPEACLLLLLLLIAAGANNAAAASTPAAISLSSPPPPPRPGYDSGYYLGCYKDRGEPNRALPVLLSGERADMTPRLCAAYAREADSSGTVCEQKVNPTKQRPKASNRIANQRPSPATANHSTLGLYRFLMYRPLLLLSSHSSRYKFYGVQYGSFCFGGNDLKRATGFGVSTQCSMQCAGDASKTCGGYWANGLHTLSLDLGCFADNATRRLPTRLDGADMQAEFKLPQFCEMLARQAGLKFYGLQYGSQCFGGNDLQWATSLGPSSGCTYPAVADNSQQFGGWWANRIFAVADNVVATDGLSNLALRKPAYASSIYNNNDNYYAPYRAVDGLRADFPVFHTANDDTSATWLSVDLGVVSTIVRVVIYNRCVCCSGRLQSAELRVGNVSLMGWADTSSITRNPLVWKQTKNLGICAPQVVTLDPPRVGRWVTLQNKNPSQTLPDYYLQVTELEVLGFPSAALWERLLHKFGKQLGVWALSGFKHPY